MKKRTKIILSTLVGLMITPVIVLFIFSKLHHNTVRGEFVAFIDHEFGDNIRFSDLKFSYLRHFPNAQILLTDVTIQDDSVVISTIGTVNILLDPIQLLRHKVKLRKLLIKDGTFHSVIDSLGNKPKLLAGKNKQSDSIHAAMVIEAESIELANCRLHFGNEIKHNDTWIQVYKAKLKIATQDSVLNFTGELEGRLDSLISNKTLLFANQEVKAKQIEFHFNRYSKKKELVGGLLYAGSLELKTSLTVQPHEDGNLIELHISGVDEFDAILDLFEFHIGIELEQTHPDAVLEIAYNQKGFVNPFNRPYSQLDFTIQNAEFEGPSLPYPLVVKEISGNYNNGEDHSPQTVALQIDTIDAKVSESFIKGRFKLNNMKDPEVDAHLNARVDMDHLFKKTGNLQLTGSIDLDLSLEGKISEIRQFHLEGRQQAYGKMEVHDLALVLNDQGYAIELLNGSTILNNHILEVTTLVGMFNKSAFHFEGHLENLDRYIIPREENLIGRFSLHFDELNLDQIDLGQDTVETQGFALTMFSGLAIEFVVSGDKLITPIGDLNNLKLDCKLKKDELKVQELVFDYDQSKTNGTGTVSFSKNGIERIDVKKITMRYPDEYAELQGSAFFGPPGLQRIQLMAGIDFNTFDVGKLINAINYLQGDTAKKGSGVKFPEEVDIQLNLHSAEMHYRDGQLFNTTVQIVADEDIAVLKNLQTDLPFGRLNANGKIRDYRSENIYYEGIADLYIDTLRINDLLALKIFGLPDLKPQKQKTAKRRSIKLPNNMDYQLNLHADQVSYNNAYIDDLEIDMSYNPDSVVLKKLHFNFTSGQVQVHGHVDHRNDQSATGYFYSNAHEIDINHFFRSFDDFGQDVFTQQNTSGSISWTSHYYFALDKNMVPLKSENTWILNATIHHAEFEEVEPIENTLFFVGHKSKDKMIISQLDINALMFQNKIYFRDVFMNDNIANLGVFGEIDLDKNDLNLNIEISLSDLFFRSKKKRVAQTLDGEVNMEKDSKIYLKMLGPLKDNKLSLERKHKFEQNREDLNEVIKSSAEYFRQKQANR